MPYVKQDSELRSDYRSLRVGGRVRETHRYVMEQKLGRKLLRTEIVHHIDGNKLNNNPDNLELMTLVEHTRMHYNNGDYVALHSPEARRKSQAGVAAYYATHPYKTAKAVLMKDKNGNILREFSSLHKVAEAGYDARHVTACCKGRRKSHKGFCWEFVK